MPERTAIIGLPVQSSTIKVQEYSLVKATAIRLLDEEGFEVDMKIDKRLENFLSKHAAPDMDGSPLTYDNVNMPDQKLYYIERIDFNTPELMRLRVTKPMVAKDNAVALKIKGLSEGKKFKVAGLYTDDQIKNWLACIKETANYVAQNFLKPSEIKMEVTIKEISLV